MGKRKYTVANVRSFKTEEEADYYRRLTDPQFKKAMKMLLDLMDKEKETNNEI